MLIQAPCAVWAGLSRIGRFGSRLIRVEGRTFGTSARKRFSGDVRQSRRFISMAPRTTLRSASMPTILLRWRSRRFAKWSRHQSVRVRSRFFFHAFIPFVVIIAASLGLILYNIDFIHRCHPCERCAACRSRWPQRALDGEDDRPMD